VPELPEVETVRRTLAPGLVGRTIVRARIYRPDFCTRPDGRRCRPPDLLQGLTIASILRRGKQLAIVSASGPLLVAHLGMTGQLTLVLPGARPARRDHIHICWTLDDGSRLLFRDPRRFGGVWALPSASDLERRWVVLGPDALTVTGERLRKRAGSSARAIKAVLLDQTVIAGIGNIYADEALFLARLHPMLPARELRGEDWAILAGAVRRTLKAAIRAGGSTVRDYRTATGAPGRAQETHAVYGRSGRKCLRCAATLRSMQVAQRTTVYCASCQSRTRGNT
jgi:formamidopyrimidine-DNA glycosylase